MIFTAYNYYQDERIYHVAKTTYDKVMKKMINS